MNTYADLFHGFGGAAIGAKQAGLEILWGIGNAVPPRMYKSILEGMI